MVVRDRGLIEGGGGVVQRAVLVELWRKIVHAALGFPAFALATPSSPLSLSCLPALFLTPLSSMETALTIFHLEMGEAIDVMKRTAGRDHGPKKFSVDPDFCIHVSIIPFPPLICPPTGVQMNSFDCAQCLIHVSYTTYLNGVI